MVVFEIVQAGDDSQCAGQRGQGDKPRAAHQRLKPGVHRHRHGDACPEAAPIDDRDHRREHQQFGGRAEHDAAAGNHAQFRHAHEAGHSSREEGHGRGDGAGENARAHRPTGIKEGIFTGESAAAHLEITADVIGAIVDADADHRDGECHAENVEMAHAGGGPGEGPGHADGEHAIGHERMTHTAKPSDDHHDHRRHREAAGPHHRLGAGPHLVIFHDRQAGQADGHRRMAGRHQRDQAAEFVGGGGGPGKTLLRFGQPQEHESQLPLLGQQVFAGQIAERRKRFGHSRPGRHEIGRPGIGTPAGRLQPRHEALAIAFQGRGRRLIGGQCARGIAEHHLAGQAAHHRADLQLRPAAIEDRLGAGDEALDIGEIGCGKVVQSLRADLGEIDLMEHRTEQRPIAGHLLRHLLEHLDHRRSRRPLHDDDRVFLLAKLRDVVGPELVVFAAGVEQVGTVDLVAEVLGRPIARYHRRRQGHQQHRPAGPQAHSRPGHQSPAQPAGGNVRRPSRRLSRPIFTSGPGEGLEFVILTHAAAVFLVLGEADDGRESARLSQH